jgi:hypothetical protein
LLTPISVGGEVGGLGTFRTALAFAAELPGSDSEADPHAATATAADTTIADASACFVNPLISVLLLDLP